MNFNQFFCVLNVSNERYWVGVTIWKSILGVRYIIRLISVKRIKCLFLSNIVNHNLSVVIFHHIYICLVMFIVLLAKNTKELENYFIYVWVSLEVYTFNNLFKRIGVNALWSYNKYETNTYVLRYTLVY